MPPQPLQRVATPVEIKLLLAAPDAATATGLRDRAILETAYATAARRAELASIRRTTLDLSQRTVRLVGKGDIERVVPLTRSAATWIGRYLREVRGQFRCSDSEPLWLGWQGP